jgi:hypothetical protein
LFARKFENVRQAVACVRPSLLSEPVGETKKSPPIVIGAGVGVAVGEGEGVGEGVRVAVGAGAETENAALAFTCSTTADTV